MPLAPKPNYCDPVRDPQVCAAAGCKPDDLEHCRCGDCKYCMGVRW